MIKKNIARNTKYIVIISILPTYVALLVTQNWKFLKEVNYGSLIEMALIQVNFMLINNRAYFEKNTKIKRNNNKKSIN